LCLWLANLNLIIHKLLESTFQTFHRGSNQPSFFINKFIKTKKIEKMSRITGNDAKGLMEAYSAVYAPQEEQAQVEELALHIIENAAGVLFTQGYDIDDLCDYFEEADAEVISEDYFSFAEGQTYISENFVAPDEHIIQQFSILEDLLGASEMLSEAGFMASQKAKLAAQRAANPNPVPRSTPIPSPAKPKVPSGAKVTTNYSVPASQMGPKLPPAAKSPGLFSKAVDWGKNLLSKGKSALKAIPGVQKAADIGSKIAKSPVGKLTGKIGSRVLPGLGVATYGMDAANRFKKGDWGGGLLSTAGAITSAIPGAGLVAGLAPAGIQMATDAMGLTGDRSKKGPSAKTPPAGAPKPPKGAGMVNVPGKGQRYFASSDKKYYKNYNDALAAHNSRTGKKPAAAAPAAPSKPAPAAPSRPPSAAPAAPSRPSSAGSESQKYRDLIKQGKTKGAEELGMQQWAKANPNLAAKVKPGQSGYEDIQKLDLPQLNKPRPEQKQDQTPTQGTANTQIDTKAADKALEAQQERDKERAKRDAEKAASSMKESHEPYEIILEYLMDRGHADTIEEAQYVMLEMDTDAIGTIMQEYKNYVLAEEISEWVDDLIDEGYDLSEYSWDDIVEYYVTEANKAERMLGLTSRQRERARNLHQYTSKPIFYGTNPNRRKKADNSDPILNKAHKEMTAKRQALHKTGRDAMSNSGF
jgi:hypothetical protein